MTPNRRSRIAPLLWAAALGALALGLAACGEDPPSSQATKPAAQPAEASAVKPPPAPPAAVPPPPTAGGGKDAPGAQPCADATLAEKVKSTLDTDRSLGAIAVDVTASAGAVTLFGTADDEASRAKAAKVAAGIPCVTSVQNKIVIVRGS